MASGAAWTFKYRVDGTEGLLYLDSERYTTYADVYAALSQSYSGYVIYKKDVPMHPSARFSSSIIDDFVLVNDGVMYESFLKDVDIAKCAILLDILRKSKEATRKRIRELEDTLTSTKAAIRSEKKRMCHLQGKHLPSKRSIVRLNEEQRRWVLEYVKEHPEVSIPNIIENVSSHFDLHYKPSERSIKALLRATK